MNQTVTVEPGDNLLQALRRAQVPMSHSCQAGRCGTCRCQVIEGKVWGGSDGLAARGEAGMVLACQTWLTESCTIRIAEPQESLVHRAWKLRARVQTFEHLAHDVWRLALTLPRRVDFSPGQYVQLWLTPQLMRPYAVGSLPGDPTLDLYIRHVRSSPFTSRLCTQIKAGDTLAVNGPLGASYLRTRIARPMLLVATGAGLGPVIALVRGTVQARLAVPMHLYIGASDPTELYALDALAELQDLHPRLSIEPVLLSGPGSVPGRNLLTQAIKQDFQNLEGWRAYLFGSPSMVNACTRILRMKQLQNEHIHAEAFASQALA